MEHKRKCISCGKIKPRKELIKITKNHETNEFVIQPDSKIFGRSFYICKNENCINVAFKKNKLTKLLKTQNELSKESFFKLIELV